jgi:two-component system, OmpR family, aerobic respiration control sensor histidine kinase ArcB
MAIKSNKEVKVNKILLVEDYPIICKMSKLMLEDIEELNCEVDVATSGQAALELIEKNTYDLILLDIGLPDIEGNTVAKCILNHEKPLIAKVPIIVITAHAEGEKAQEYLCLGVQRVIIKPLTFEIAMDFLEYLS